MLDAENEPATAQRLGYIIENAGKEKLADVIHDWLPPQLALVPLGPGESWPDDCAGGPSVGGFLNNSGETWTMISLTRRDLFLAHQALFLGPSQRQVEQDLLLCHTDGCVVRGFIFAEQIAMPSGRCCTRFISRPASRYSEDIDLVVVA